MINWFYTFPESRGNRQIVWQPERRLQNRIDALCYQICISNQELDKAVLEARVARHLFERLKENPSDKLICDHWSAFLSRYGAIAVWKIDTLMPAERPTELSFQDLLLMMFDTVNFNLRKRGFFDNFAPQRNGDEFFYPTLKSYTRSKVGWLLYDQIRQVDGMENFGRTNLGLVARSSRKRVRESLKALGIIEPQLSQYLLLWSCFKEVVSSVRNMRVDLLQQQHLQEIADRYNRLCNDVNLLVKQNRIIKYEDARQWLNEIGSAIRYYSNLPSITSLDALQISDGDTTSLLEDVLIEQEKNHSNARIVECIYEWLQNMQEEEKVLFLTRGLALTQAQTGRELGKNQATISRRYSNLLQQGLLQILSCLQLSSKYECNSEQLDKINAWIEETLDRYYAEVIDQFFNEAIQIILSDQQLIEILQLVYVNRLEIPAIAAQIAISESEINEGLENAKQVVVKSITEQIQTKIKITFQPGGAAVEEIAVLTEDRLNTILHLCIQ